MQIRNTVERLAIIKVMYRIIGAFIMKFTTITISLILLILDKRIAYFIS